MHESTLRDYFENKTKLADLITDLKGTVQQTSYDVFTHTIVSMGTEFEVTAGHLIRLCDAVLSEQLDPQELATIGLCLAMSGAFWWDEDSKEGNRVEDTVHCWASPEINYPLTLPNIVKFREGLLTGKDTFTRADLSK